MTRRSRSIPVTLAELAIATPQVVTHRLARLAAAGPAPGARDRREFQRMGSEKVAAFWESWGAMALQAAGAQQRALWSMQTALWRALWFPMAAGRAGTAIGPGALQQWQRSALDVFAHGLAPVHRRAVANSRRLAAPRRRR